MLCYVMLCYIILYYIILYCNMCIYIYCNMCIYIYIIVLPIYPLKTCRVCSHEEVVPVGHDVGMVQASPKSPVRRRKRAPKRQALSGAQEG